MNLMEACLEFEKDEYIKNVLGNDLVQKYTQAKKKGIRGICNPGHRMGA